MPSQLVADVVVNLPGALPPRVHRGPDTDALAQFAKIRKLRILSGRIVGKRIVCLDIPDKYAFMQPELIALLERKAGSFLRHS
nr:hypothetical protein [Paraburkholderia kururiensis]